MSAPPPADRFWSYWALAGMPILFGIFAWSMSQYDPMFRTWPAGAGQMADGLYRFSMLILSPALALGWASGMWFWRRGLTGVYWRLLAAIAAIWMLAVGGVLAMKLLL